MGKKDHQRTKGNTKPSSSARSAQLLAASGARTGFIGFGSSSPSSLSSADNPSPSFVPILDFESFGADDLSSGIPGDIRGALRKMGKKDTVTKQKAVGEFCALCESASVETVLTVLPFWPRIYTKIAVDNDRRVREAAQRANLKVVTSVGKALAPYLKSLMPAWFLSQHDPHAPAAASTARCALAEAFPADAKREEAVTFCRKEILAAIRENLVEQTPQTMSDPSSTSVEDMEAKYNRTVAASLLGFSDLLRLLRAAAETKTDENGIFVAVEATLEEMEKCAKFWKFGSSKVPMVRQSFYTLIVASLTQLSSADVAVALLGPSKLVGATFARMDDRSDADPLVLCSVWDACLAAVARWQDWHAHAGLDKTVVPKMQALLKRGPSAVPPEIYPKVLPLMGRLPRESLGRHGTAILAALRTGIEVVDEDEGEEVKTRAKGAIKSDSAIAAYFECAAFVASRAEEDVGASVIQDVVDAVMDLMEREVSRGRQRSPRVFSAFAEKFLDPISSREELSVVVWTRLNAQVRYSHETTSDGDSGRLDTLLELIRSISGNRRDSARKKKRGGVRFEVEKKEECGDKLEMPQVREPGGSNRRRIAEMAACLAAASLLKSAEDENHSRFAIELVETLADDETFYRLLNQRLKTPNSGDSEAFSFLRYWIFGDEESGRRITRGAKDLSRLGVTVYSSLKSKSERVAFFERINSIDDEESAAAFFADLCRNLRGSKRSREDPEASAWLASNDLGGRLVSLLEAEMATSGDEETNGSTKRELALTIAENGDFISEANLVAVYVALTAGLMPDLDSPAAFDRSVDFACDVLGRLGERNKLAFVVGEAADVVVKLMSLDCKFGTEKDDWLLSEGTRAKLRNCWRNGFEAFVQNSKEDDPKVEELLSACAGLVRNCIQLSVALPAAHEVEHLAGVAKIIADSAVEDAECDDVAVQRRQTTIREMFPPPTQWTEMREAESGKGDRMRSILLESPAESVPVFREQELLLEVESSASPSCRHIAFAYLFDLLFDDTHYQEARDEPMGDPAPMEDNYAEVFDKPADPVQEEGKDGRGRRENIPLAEIELLVALVSEFLNSATFAATATLRTPDLETVAGKLAERVRRRETFLERLNGEAADAVLKWTEDKCLIGTGGWCRSLHYLLLTRPSKVDLRTHVGEGREGSLAAVQRTQVLLRLCGSDEDTERMVSTMLATELGRILSLEGDGLAASEAVLSSLAIVASCLHQGRVRVEVNAEAVMAWVERARKEGGGESFLYDRDVTSAPQMDVSFVATVAAVLAELLTNPTAAGSLKPESWDAILCSLSSWIQSFDESVKEEGATKNLKVIVFGREVARLAARVTAVLGSPDSSYTGPENVSEEWTEFFSEGIFSILLSSFVRLSTDPETNSVLLGALGAALAFIPDKELFGHRLEPKYFADTDVESSLPENILFLLNHLCPMLAPDKIGGATVKMAAFKLLDRVMPKIVADTANVAATGKREDEDYCELPFRLVELLTQTEPVVATLFAEFEFGETVPVPPDTAAHECLTSYLLTWKLILTLVSGASSELRPRFTEFVRREKFLETLVPSLFHLMPKRTFETNIMSAFPFDKEEGALTTLLQVEKDGAYELSALACGVYLGMLKQLPAMVRQWFNAAADKRTADEVESFTAKYVTPVLWAEEGESINGSKTAFDNMTIRVRPSVREVVATYTVDDGSMELIVVIPANFPLGAVKVETGKKVGVGNNLWRNWMLQLTTFLQHQNGSIVDGLTVWKSNVDKRFEGVEECYICFYILHGANHSLPKVACRTCKKKFHSACLYKWFSTSNQSTCPLCRNLF